MICRPSDFGFIGTRDPSPVPASRTLRIADLEVVDAGDRLVVQTRDARLRFECLEFFGSLMMRRNVNLFGLLPASPHLPRVTIDDVVVCREQWRVPVSDARFATRGGDVDRFVECQRWAHQLSLPPFVFVKLPTERKPTYVDLTSPVYVDLLARFVRGLQRTDPSGVVTITEMLPSFGGAWLVDTAGRSPPSSRSNALTRLARRWGTPDAPEGLWYRDFGSFKIWGEGRYPKTFLLVVSA